MGRRKRPRFAGLPILVTPKDQDEVQKIANVEDRGPALTKRNLELAERWLEGEAKQLGMRRDTEIMEFIHASRAPFSIPKDPKAQARWLGVPRRIRNPDVTGFKGLTKRQLRQMARSLQIDGELVRALNDRDPIVTGMLDPPRGKTIAHLGPPYGQETDPRWANICRDSEIFNALNMRPHWCVSGCHWYIAGQHRQEHCFRHSNIGRQNALRARRRLARRLFETLRRAEEILIARGRVSTD